MFLEDLIKHEVVLDFKIRQKNLKQKQNIREVKQIIKKKIWDFFPNEKDIRLVNLRKKKRYFWTIIKK